MVSERRIFRTSLLSMFTAGDLQELNRLDGRFLGPQGDAKAYEQRWRLYDRALAKDLDSQLGFPLLRDSTTVLPPGSMAALSTTLQQRTDDISGAIRGLGAPGFRSVGRAQGPN